MTARPSLQHLSLSLFSLPVVGARVRYASEREREMIIIEAAATGALAGVPMPSGRSGWDTVRVQIDFLDHIHTAQSVAALC